MIVPNAKVLLVTYKRTYRSDPPWFPFKEETVDAYITPKRIKVRNMTFDRATGSEIRRYSWSAQYQHKVKELEAA